MVMETAVEKSRMKVPWEGGKASVSIHTWGYAIRIIDLTFSRTLIHGREGDRGKHKSSRLDFGDQVMYMALEDEEMYEGYGKDHPKGMRKKGRGCMCMRCLWA